MTRMPHWLLAVALLALSFSVNAQQPIKNAIPDRARPLPLSAVRVTGGPLKRAQDLNGEYLLKLEPDRMLAYYRKRAGLEPKAQGYAGWDGDGRNLTGHIAGLLGHRGQRSQLRHRRSRQGRILWTTRRACRTR